MRDPGPPRGLLRPHPPAGVEHVRIAPPASLAELVAHIWWVRWDLPSEPFVTETLPHPSLHLTFEPRRARIVGVQTGKFTRRLAGTGRVLGIKLRPAALSSLTRTPASRLTDRTLPLAAILGSDVRALSRAIDDAEPDRTACALAIESWLAPRIAPLSTEALLVRDLVERAIDDASLVRVEQLAELAHLDVRTLQRRFARLVGVSPKWILSRRRLHEAAARLAEPEPPTLAALAAELGYHDQAHFARDFKAIVGRSPGAHARQLRADEQRAR
jgi:AraC-like DNA-binding protein